MVSVELLAMVSPTLICEIHRRVGVLQTVRNGNIFVVIPRCAVPLATSSNYDNRYDNLQGTLNCVYIHKIKTTETAHRRNCAHAWNMTAILRVGNDHSITFHRNLHVTIFSHNASSPDFNKFETFSKTAATRQPNPSSFRVPGKSFRIVIFRRAWFEFYWFSLDCAHESIHCRSAGGTCSSQTMKSL